MMHDAVFIFLFFGLVYCAIKAFEYGIQLSKVEDKLDRANCMIRVKDAELNVLQEELKNAREELVVAKMKTI